MEIEGSIAVDRFEGYSIGARIIQGIAGLSRFASHRPHSYHATGCFALALRVLRTIKGDDGAAIVLPTSRCKSGVRLLRMGGLQSLEHGFIIAPQPNHIAQDVEIAKLRMRNLAMRTLIFWGGKRFWRGSLAVSTQYR